MMTPKERASMQQALEALEAAGAVPSWFTDYRHKAITTLREALDQPDEIDWVETNKALAKEIIELKKQIEQPVSQEPVCCDKCGSKLGTTVVPCDCTAPQPVKEVELTDADLLIIRDEYGLSWEVLDYARAVIAAYKEKNK